MLVLIILFVICLIIVAIFDLTKYIITSMFKAVILAILILIASFIFHRLDISPIKISSTQYTYSSY